MCPYSSKSKAEQKPPPRLSSSFGFTAEKYVLIFMVI